MHKHLITISLLCLLAGGLVMAPGASAQDARCFPETNQCISGRFRQYWEQNGGLAVFGFPISSETVQEGRPVQYFERQRFELHSENQRPYDVLLGRLGAELLQARGIDWMTQPTSPGPVAGCLYFAETKHNVCNQQSNGGFLQVWSSNGLEFDGRAGKSYAESLALFGLPLTEPYEFTNDQGQTYQTQWFERARFEWHPENQPPYLVLLGRLGAESAAPAPSSAAYDKPNSPADLLTSFYNAVNRQEYQRAYGYWETPPSSYEEFAAGYANTASVQLIIEPRSRIEGAAGSLYSQVPTVLVATQRDGTQQTFAGCYTTRASNVDPQPSSWRIQSATVAAAPAGQSVATLLANSCTSEQATAFDKPDSPVDLLISYYSAVNLRDYQRAYGYWQNSPTSYNEFVQGYTNTVSVRLVVEPPTAWDTVSGQPYARVPAVLVASHRDGTQQMFAGCYRVSATGANGAWRILTTSTVAAAPDNASIATMLRQQC